jgi:transposase InsO family protein
MPNDNNNKPRNPLCKWYHKISMEEFSIDHRKSSPYYPQENGAVESFNKTIHKGLTKICGVDGDDWDEKVHIVLWEYRTTYKRSTGQTPFKLVYGQEVTDPLHFRANAERVTLVELQYWPFPVCKRVTCWRAALTLCYGSRHCKTSWK